MDQHLGGEDVVKDIKNMGCGIGHSHGKGAAWHCTIPGLGKGQRMEVHLGRQTSGFLLVGEVRVSIFLGLCIQSWVFPGPAEWAFCLLKGDLFLQI